MRCPLTPDNLSDNLAFICFSQPMRPACGLEEILCRSLFTISVCKRNSSTPTSHHDEVVCFFGSSATFGFSRPQVFPCNENAIFPVRLCHVHVYAFKNPSLLKSGTKRAVSLFLLLSKHGTLPSYSGNICSHTHSYILYISPC